MKQMENLKAGHIEIKSHYLTLPAFLNWILPPSRWMKGCWLFRNDRGGLSRKLPKTRFIDNGDFLEVQDGSQFKIRTDLEYPHRVAYQLVFDLWIVDMVAGLRIFPDRISPATRFFPLADGLDHECALLWVRFSARTGSCLSGLAQ